MTRPPARLQLRLRRALGPALYLASLAALYPLCAAAFGAAGDGARRLYGRIMMDRPRVTPGDRLMLGVYRPEAPASFAEVKHLEGAIGQQFHIVSIYTTWGPRQEDRFPMREMDAIADSGATPLVTWEPWTAAFPQRAGAGLDRTNLQAIADGAYDDYVRAWAADAVLYGRSFFLRFAHEMNGDQYPWTLHAGNSREAFIAAWRHVWTVFQHMGARNVAWVWSPKDAAPDALYPGDAYVDWIGAGVFNYGAYADGVWHSFEYLYEPVYRAAARYSKPILIAELGCARLGGDAGEWYRRALQLLPRRYPRTRAVVLFDNPADETLAGSVIDWQLGDRPEALSALSAATANGVWLP